MLDEASIARSNVERMITPADFAMIAIRVLKDKFPDSSSFYVNADKMRLQAALSAKNHFTDPFLVGARIGYAYAFAIVREWQSMANPRIEKVLSVQGGPTDGTCTS